MLTDWNDLRFFLAVARDGSLSAASRSLKVDPATVSRRVTSLEGSLGTKLFDRRVDGYRLTPTGGKLLERAELVEKSFVDLSRTAEAESPVACGTVTVTASESFTLPLLIPSIALLRQRHPGIQLDIVTSNRVLSLARREADVAVRMARPVEGDLVAKRIGTMRYGLFASEAYLEREGEPRSVDDLRRHTMVDWLEDYSRVETVNWFRRIAAQGYPAVRMTGTGERLRATLEGAGIGCISYALADGTGLRRVLPEIEAPPTELWLVAHPDAAKAKRIRVVLDHIAEVAAAGSAMLRGTTLSRHSPADAAD